MKYEVVFKDKSIQAVQVVCDAVEIRNDILKFKTETEGVWTTVGIINRKEILSCLAT